MKPTRIKAPSLTEVVSIEPFDYGHKRRVTVVNKDTGQLYELIYGDSVTERAIRVRAPALARKDGRKIN